MKTQVEIDDTMQETIDSAIEDTKQLLLDYCKENTPDALPDLSNDLDYSGGFHEIIDSAIPIYTKEIKDLFFLYGETIEAAFDDAGIWEKKNEGWPNGWQAAAIYCYLEQEVREWWDECAEDVFNEWKEKHDAEEKANEPTA